MGITHLELDMRSGGGAFYVTGEVSIFLSICPFLRTLVIRSIAGLEDELEDELEFLSRFPDFLEDGFPIIRLTEVAAENLKRIVKELFETLTNRTEYYCPSLSVIELFCLPVESSYIVPLVHRLSSGALTPGTNRARLLLSGCVGVAAKDYQPVETMTVVVIE